MAIMAVEMQEMLLATLLRLSPMLEGSCSEGPELPRRERGRALTSTLVEEELLQEAHREDTDSTAMLLAEGAAGRTLPMTATKT